MDEIDNNILAYESKESEIKKDSLGKWVLFHDSEHKGTFDSFEEAADAATDFEPGTYLIRQVGVSELVLPVMFINK